MPHHKLFRLIFFLSVLLIADRLIKLASLHGDISTQSGFLDFKSTINTNWLFGLINGNAVVTVFVGLLLLFIVGFLIVVLKNNQSASGWGWGLVLIGGASNYWDRLWYGGVIDFVNFVNLTQFNFSDLYLISGLSVLILNSKTRHVS